MAAGGTTLLVPEETLIREAPLLVSLLKEMKDGLDLVRWKVQDLTVKVKQNQFPTADGISYLDTKHLLLLGYCQSLVYYLLRKAKGLPIEGQPVVRSLVETRLFLEKIRPIDKKLEYQVQKLTRAAGGRAVTEKPASANDNQLSETQEKEEDPLRYRPNPDMLVAKSMPGDQGDRGVYRPPRIAPMSMDEDKMSKEEKQARRRDKELLRRAKQSGYMDDLIGNLEGRPEEIRETVGVESRELSRYIEKREHMEKQEEEAFIRAPVTKREKKLEKYMKRSRDGMRGLTDGFYDEIRSLPLEEENDDVPTFMSTSAGGKRYKKNKRKH